MWASGKKEVDGLKRISQINTEEQFRNLELWGQSI